MTRQSKTSWENSSSWYGQIVGEKGHYYHREIIIPKLLNLMNLSKRKEKVRVLDLACGQGVIERALPKGVEYTGIDASRSLIAEAKKSKKYPNATFLCQDVLKPLPIPPNHFTDAMVILALQNIEDPLKVLKNASAHLQKLGKFYLVLNHPCFRIPRQTHWQIDEAKKMQVRRVDMYLSSMKIPIAIKPGQKAKSQTTWSFHYSLSQLFSWLKDTGFVTLDMQEWTSNKKSTGSKAKMENRARAEFPLFLCLVCQKALIE